jgi:hypothetical protein
MLRFLKWVRIIPRRIWNRHIYKHQHIPSTVIERYEYDTSSNNRKILRIPLPPTMRRQIRLDKKILLNR